ncbi:MAG: TonB-dependent receptor [Bacteroidota bacterium]
MRFIVTSYGLIMSLLTFAQVDEGTVYGIISDVEGTKLIGVTVGIPSLGIGDITGVDGNYELRLPVGSYNLVISSTGFLTKKVSVTVNENQKLRQNLELQKSITELQEVIVSAESNEAVLRKSLNSIEVIILETAVSRSADIGQILAQTKGVSVQRSGGLGSNMRLSLNGLTDDQIRFFYYHVPIEFSAFGFGLANIPIGMLERVDIYKGIVPTKLGTDALGGAINVIPKKAQPGWHGSGSYQHGSFGTHRLEANLSYYNSEGFFSNTGIYYDFAENDYNISIGVPNDQGRLEERSIKKFNDAYQGFGVTTEIGIKGRKNLDLLSFELYTSANNKEIQHAQLAVQQINGKSLIVGVPFGEVDFARKSSGATVRYKQLAFRKLNIEAALAYNFNRTEYLDSASRFYNWFGEVIDQRATQGEVEPGTPAYQFLDTHTAFHRINFSYSFDNLNTINAQTNAINAVRDGDDRFRNFFDPLSSESSFNSRVSSIEYLKESASKKLETSFFLKHYFVKYEAEEPTFDGESLLKTSNKKSEWGAGASLRCQISPQLLGKISYEWTTRLPRVDEVLGDGAFIADNLELNPERAHNSNAELQITQPKGSSWKWTINPVLFWREIADHIVFLQGIGLSSIYANVFTARSLGSELGVKLTSPNERWNFAVNGTYLNYINTSSEGLYEPQNGDRIPNRPYLFANSNVDYSHEFAKGKLRLFADSRYVGNYFISWESLGSANNKQIVPNQFTINLGTTYERDFGKTRWFITAEIFNITNAEVFDFFAVQRPGVSYFIKNTFQF